MIRTTFAGGVTGIESLGRLNAFVQDIATSRIAFHANRMLDAQIQEAGDVNYIIEVDGLKAPDRKSFDTAKRKVVIRFTDELLRLAVKDFVNILRESIQINGAKGAKGSWIDLGAMAASVVVYYGGKDKGLRRIGENEEIPEFGPGDVLLLTPVYDAQMFANARKFGATSIMAKASAQIRKRITGTSSAKGANKRSFLRVTAERSRAVFAKLAAGTSGQSLRPDGSVIKMTVPRPGMDSAWSIAIRYREVAK